MKKFLIALLFSFLSAQVYADNRTCKDSSGYRIEMQSVCPLPTSSRDADSDLAQVNSTEMKSAIQVYKNNALIHSGFYTCNGIQLDSDGRTTTFENADFIADFSVGDGMGIDPDVFSSSVSAKQGDDVALIYCD